MSTTLLYIPRSALAQVDVESLVRLYLSTDVNRVDMHGGRKAALKYLININAVGYDLSSYIDKNQWEKIEKQFEKLKETDPFKKEFSSDNDETFEPYWELSSDSSRIHQLAKSARIFNNRKTPFTHEQLKVYFNRMQIDNIPFSNGTLESSGFLDGEAKDNMTKYPIAERHNTGEILTKKARVEQAIFDVPDDKQIIVLDFADERMPGGLFLYGASTQEETICYHSDTYRGLLDLKYNRFDGGFLIPEFGCIYIKNVQFFKPPEHTTSKQIDVIAAACYDLTGEHGLHLPPDTEAMIEFNTERKLETIIAAAQANSNGNGENTYLLIGPIGCGAFQNKIQTIARLWARLLLEKLNEKLDTEQRHTFAQVWLISGTDEKLKVFEKVFQLDASKRL